MGYRQAVTLDHLQGRMNATMRSTNRAMVVVGAPIGRILGDAIGFRTMLWVSASGFLVVAVGLGLSRFEEHVSIRIRQESWWSDGSTVW